MLMVISPAKTLDFDSPLATQRHTQPGFLEESARLVERLCELSPPALAELMGISAELASLNVGRNLNWSLPFSRENARAALLAFKGDVYQGLAVEDFTEADFDAAQRHLRILSGLYGLLRPLDLIQPYRLEMGTRLTNPRGRNLYQFWGDRITRALNDALEESGGPLVNLASEEYFKSVQPAGLAVPVITPVFKDRAGQGYKVISFHAKRARGMMARFALRERLDRVEQLQEFTAGGYVFRPDLSSPREWVFTREKAPA